MEAMLLGSCLFFCKMGPVVPASPAPQGLQPGLRGIGLRLAILCRTALALMLQSPHRSCSSSHPPSVSTEVLCEQHLDSSA